MANRGKNYWIALVPAMFMTVVVTSYILAAPEGFVRFFGDKDIKVIEHIAIAIGCAVSYTHLRAHETVLDLVCRLLLEKKKK